MRSALIILAIVCSTCAAIFAQAPNPPSSLQSLKVATSTTSPDDLLKGEPNYWNQASFKHVALNRTPPLFDTDEPAAVEIPTLDVRCARAGEKLLVQLNWKDPTHDVVMLQDVPNTAPETRFRKVQTEENDRFFDAAAVMIPSRTDAGLAPSLQMGDADHPVQIYYWNATRGAMLMEARGRSTTRRTGQTFPANGLYQNGQWTVTFELPNESRGTLIAFAVWNGSQKDRDGRKYFSVWQVLE